VYVHDVNVHETPPTFVYTHVVYVHETFAPTASVCERSNSTRGLCARRLRTKIKRNVLSRNFVQTKTVRGRLAQRPCIEFEHLQTLAVRANVSCTYTTCVYTKRPPTFVYVHVVYVHETFAPTASVCERSFSFYAICSKCLRTKLKRTVLSRNFVQTKTVRRRPAQSMRVEFEHLQTLAVRANVSCTYTT